MDPISGRENHEIRCVRARDTPEAAGSSSRPDLRLEPGFVDSAPRACDDACMTGIRVVQLALVLAGITLGVLAYQVQMDNVPTTTTLRSWGSIAAAWSFLAAGLV